MRLRLGLLQDPAAIDRQIEREAAEAAAKKARTSSVPTVKTKDEMEEENAALKAERKAIKEQVKDNLEKSTLRRIRPLSEAKAIDSGATFISEAFLFMVAGGLIVFETWRARRKEGARREQVEDRLQVLEEEIRRTREQEEASEAVIEALKSEVEQLRREKIAKANARDMADEKFEPTETSIKEETTGEDRTSTKDGASTDGETSMVETTTDDTTTEDETTIQDETATKDETLEDENRQQASDTSEGIAEDDSSATGESSSTNEDS